MDKSVKPIAQRQRRIPFHLRAKVDTELCRLEQEDIIEKVPDTDETAWISPVVIVPEKDDQIRLCVDMRAANTAIKRVYHPIPIVRDISFDLNGAKYFTKLDMSQAYHQLELSTPSRSTSPHSPPMQGYTLLNVSIMVQTQQLKYSRIPCSKFYTASRGSVTLLMTFSCLAQRMRNMIELSQNAYNAWKLMV